MLVASTIFPQPFVTMVQYQACLTWNLNLFFVGPKAPTASLDVVAANRFIDHAIPDLTPGLYFQSLSADVTYG
jgi:hypothetical protein